MSEDKSQEPVEQEEKEEEAPPTLGVRVSDVIKPQDAFGRR